jgi:hypothetical protein
VSAFLFLTPVPAELLGLLRNGLREYRNCPYGPLFLILTFVVVIMVFLAVAHLNVSMHGKLVQ